MKYLIATFLTIYILTSCTYRPKEKRLSKFQNNDGKIIKSFYKELGDTVEFTRLLLTNSEIIVQNEQIFIGEYALSHQKFKGVNHLKIDNTSIDSLTSRFMNDGFVSKIVDERDVMFIQIVPDSIMGNIDALKFLNLRQVIEDVIDERLQSKKYGEWFAGDMGAGGNMLFFINDWGKATEVVIEVLKDENLIDHVLIAKRIMKTDDDWNYEIVYPLEYEGIFNPM